MPVLFRILRESTLLSLQQLWNNKLRTTLSLLGVTVGIFSIIAILTAVDGLSRNVESSINKLGDDLVMIQKWPLYTGRDYPWWKYFQRPEADIRDYAYIKERSQTVDKAAFSMFVSDAAVSYKGRNLRGLKVVGITHDYIDLVKFEIGAGRYFVRQESAAGYRVAVIGAKVADELFGEDVVDPIGREILIDNVRVKVIGVIKREGEDLLGFNFDEDVLVPYEMVERAFTSQDRMSDPTVFVLPVDGVGGDAMMAEVTGLMRSHRRLRPREADNFSLVRFSLITQSFGSMLSALNIAGWVIGAFALLVGGFGIANIMYVSVKERTGIIGIKKAMGARSQYILFEFLTESILLCLIGGMVGLLIIALSLGPINKATGFEFMLSMKNVSIGLGVSVVIGLVAGILPAKQASMLDPVEAMRSK